jgi:hypothetical protein
MSVPLRMPPVAMMRGRGRGAGPGGGGGDAPVPQLVGELALVLVDGAVGLDGDPAGAAGAADVDVADACGVETTADALGEAAAGLLDDDRDR